MQIPIADRRTAVFKKVLLIVQYNLLQAIVVTRMCKRVVTERKALTSVCTYITSRQF